jgi:hypothetical protein
MPVTLTASAATVASPNLVDAGRAKQKREALQIKDWRKAAGRIDQTSDAQDAWELGEAWRKAQQEV